MERTRESEYLDEMARECIEYALEFDVGLMQALDDIASEVGAAGFPMSERQINLIRERLKNVEM